MTQNLDPSQMTPAMLAGGGLGLLVLVSGLIIDTVFVLRLLTHRIDWPARAERIRLRPWQWHNGGMILLGLGALQAALLLAMQASTLVFRPSEDVLIAVSVIVQTCLFHGTGLFLVLWFLRSRRISLRQAFGVRRTELGRNVKHGIAFYLGAMPVVAAAAVLSRYLLDALHYPVEPQSVILILTEGRYSLWIQTYLAVLAVLVAPIIEEVLFRGIALPLALKHTPRAVSAVCAVSLIFAAIHFHIPSVLPLFTIASAFALAYLYSGSLAAPIVMHMLFNGVTILLLFVLKDTDILAFRLVLRLAGG